MKNIHYNKLFLSMVLCFSTHAFAAPGDLPAESSSAIANIAASNNLFSLRLHDRMGESQYADKLKNAPLVGSGWLRQVGRHNRFKEDSGQFKNKSNSYTVQVGGDIARWTDDENGRFHLGGMVGYGYNNNRSTDKSSGEWSKGRVKGYSLGIYATFYDHNIDSEGFYIDGWVTYARLKNSIRPEDNKQINYDSDGFTLSTEAGRTIKLFSTPQSRFYLRPVMQITWMGVKADDAEDSLGNKIDSKGHNNWQIRAGTRAYLSNDCGVNCNYQPFAELNYIHNTKRFSVEWDDKKIQQKGSKNLAELKLGIESRVSESITLWAHTAYQQGKNSYQDVSGSFGAKVIL